MLGRLIGGQCWEDWSWEIEEVSTGVERVCEAMRRARLQVVVWTCTLAAVHGID